MNTNLLFIFFSMFFVSFMGLPFFKEKDPRILLGQHLVKVSRNAEQNYGFSTTGSSISFPEKNLKKAGLCFESTIQLSIDELSQILFDIASELKDDLNADPILCEYMDEHYFDFSNVSVEIYFRDSYGNRVFHPNLSVAELVRNEFIFFTSDPENLNRFKSEVIHKLDPELFTRSGRKNRE